MIRVMSLCLALSAASGCTYSFGGNVHAMGTRYRAVHLTSFGGNIDVPSAPRGVRLRSFGGDVRLGAIEGVSTAASFGGDVVVESLEGSARLSSFGGAVDVQVADGETDAPRVVSIASYGGGVVVRVPADFSARFDVRLRSRHGPTDITSDFALTESREKGRSPRLWRRYDELHATGVIGDGRHLIRIRADDADVRIEKI